LTVGVVTKPFHFEGTRRMKMAEEGLKELQSYVDTLIVIPNQNLFRVVNDKTTFADGFKMADSVLQSAVRGVTDLIVMPGLINLDFADIRSVMQEMGKAVMGAGEATGDNRAIEAAEKAISNPLLDDVSMKGAKGVIVNITGGYDMTLFEVDEACNRIRDEVDPDANIIFGSTFDEALEGTIRVSVVATGIDAVVAAQKQPITTSNRGMMGSVSAQPIRASRFEQMRPQQQPAMRIPEPVSAPVANVQSARASFPKNFSYAPVSQPVQQQPIYQQDVASNEASYVRGTRMGDAYIPPQPMEVSGSVGYSSQVAQKPVQQAPVYYQQEESAPQQAQPQSQTPARRKSPSLFERITSGYRRVEASIESFSANEADDFGGQQQGQQQAQRSQQRVIPTVSAPIAGQQPAQGRLNIDAPSSVAKTEEDELDIPAFLRRQTS
jgi:cell division protein FtsZ